MSVFEKYLFQIQTPSLEKLETKFIVKIMFYSLKSFSCFSGGFLKAFLHGCDVQQERNWEFMSTYDVTSVVVRGLNSNS